MGGHDLQMDTIAVRKNQTTITGLSFKVGPSNHEVHIPTIEAYYHLSGITSGCVKELTIHSPKIILHHNTEVPLPTLAEITQSLESTIQQLEKIDHVSIDDIQAELKATGSDYKIQCQFKQNEDKAQKIYTLTLASDFLKGQGVMINKGTMVSLTMDLTDVHLQPELFTFESPTLHLGIEKSFTDDLVKIKTKGTITKAGTSSYGHLVNPLILDWDLQKTDSLVTGTALFQLKDNPEGEKITIIPDFDYINTLGHITVNADFSPEKFWTFEAIAKHFIPEFTQIEGHIKTEGDIKWMGSWQNIDTNLSILLKDCALTVDDAKIKGINTTITMNKFNPFVVSQAQTLKAEAVSIKNLHLTNVVAVVSTMDDGEWKFHNFHSNVFGGEVSLHTISQDGKSFLEGVKFKGDCNNIELSDLVKYSEIADLQAEAKLVGEGDFKYSSKGLEVIQASLRSTSPEGRLHYKAKSEPEHTGNQAAEIAMKALEELHFTLLEIAITPNDATPEGDIQAKIKLLGFNPKVLNGYPFEFNIQTSGHLGSLMRNAINNLAPIKNMEDINKMVKE